MYVTTAAYFEETAISTFYLISRQSFEARLIRHIENPSASQEDSVWFAIRNIVYASGCRALMSKTHSWRESQSKSGQYFENALRVETDLIHGAYGLSAIRALLAMVSVKKSDQGMRLQLTESYARLSFLKEEAARNSNTCSSGALCVSPNPKAYTYAPTLQEFLGKRTQSEVGYSGHCIVSKNTSHCAPGVHRYDG